FRHSHRLLAPDVLLCLGGGDRELSVQARRCDDVDDIDVVVVLDVIERLIAVDVLVGDPVVGLPGRNFGGSSRYDSGKTTVLCELQSWRQLPAGVGAET